MKPDDPRLAPEHQQMNRSNDPAVTAELDAAAPATAMDSRRQRLTGSAVGVGSVDFDDPGAFDVGESEEQAPGQSGAPTGGR